MPVKLEDPLDLPEMHLFASNPITEPLLPDDIWHKFELDFWNLPSISDVLQDLPLETPLPRLDDVWAGNHDCMWAGHCGSREHSNDDTRHNRLIPAASFVRPPAPPPKRGDGDHRQSLLKPTVRAAAAPVLHTPPMSDDEETKNSTNVLKLLRDAIEDCDLDEEIDLCNYLEGRGDADVVGGMCAVKEELEEEEEEEESEEEEEEDDEEEIDVANEAQQPVVTSAEIRSCQAAAESDHSYHKGGQSSGMRLAELGIDTPSDSEEEIDVVSVVDKMQFQSKMVFSLPTNPSNRDRQTIQRRMATAISQRRNAPAPPVTPSGGGIKTILPQRKTATRKSPADSYAPATTKRKSAESTPTRGVKRARQYRNGPHKRRHYGHSSDSEPEPSEKRSLHNNMERQRRIDLRNAFEDLRVLVPEVSKKERAAKVVILREAALFCDHLGNVARNQVKATADLNRRQDWLRWRVAELRRELAALR